MNLARILIAGTAGTTAMTLFSYFVSKKKKRNFKEPELLGKMVDRITPLNKTESQASGWALHYAAGIAFALVYSQMLEYTDLEPTVKNGMIVGAASGIPAVMIWYLVFKLHPHPPKTSKRYYSHLVAAHLVFGAFTFWSYASQKRSVTSN